MVKPGDNVVALHGQKEECPGQVLRKRDCVRWNEVAEASGCERTTAFQD